jgi:hypothetical protein
MADILQTDSPIAVDAEQTSLSEAFLREFGKQPKDKATLEASSSPAARLVAEHFNQLSHLEDRRDGWPRFSTPPSVVTYNDLKEMEKLADARTGLQHHYSQEDIGSMQGRDVGWASVYGIGCGAAAGGVLRLALPMLRGRGALVSAGIVALGAVAGYKAGEFLGQKSFDSFAENSTYLSVERARYGDSLGHAWQQNAKIAGTATIVAGLASFGLFAAPRVAIGLGAVGLVTYLTNGIAYKLGNRSAINEMEAEAELGKRLMREWNSQGH